MTGSDPAARTTDRGGALPLAAALLLCATVGALTQIPVREGALFLATGLAVGGTAFAFVVRLFAPFAARGRGAAVRLGVLAGLAAWAGSWPVAWAMDTREIATGLRYETGARTDASRALRARLGDPHDRPPPPDDGEDFDLPPAPSVAEVRAALGLGGWLSARLDGGFATRPWTLGDAPRGPWVPLLWLLDACLWTGFGVAAALLARRGPSRQARRRAGR